MEQLTNLALTNVVILCGGLGTRLRPLISDRPKVLAKIRDRTFIDLLLEDLITQGSKRIIFCVGHLKEMLQDHVTSTYKTIETIFSSEDQPLGTGGAVKNAIPHIKSQTFIVMNGDSICRINYNDLLSAHHQNKSLFTMALSQPHERKDGGNVLIDKKQRIIAFKEKTELDTPGLINAGIYVMNKKIFNLMPEPQTFSLENDLFPNLITQKSYGFLTESDVIDIGTVDRYTKAANTL